MKKILAVSLILILASCNEGQQPAARTAADADSTTVRDTMPVTQQVAGCYTYISRRDTAGLRLEERNANLTGALSYNYFEKDRNEGSFQGEVRNGILSGWYLFKSEGVMSVRQVAWQLRGSDLWPAIGEMQERNDTMMFRDLSSVRYDSSLAFKKVPCTL